MKNLKSLFVSTISILFFFIISGCGSSPNAPILLPQFNPAIPFNAYNIAANNTTTVAPSQRPQTKAEFLATLTSQGIKLTDKQISEVCQFTRLNPNGQWTPGPMNDRRKNLEGHFYKHGKEFSPPPGNPDEYLARAIAFIKRHDINTEFYFDCDSYQKGYVSVVKWDLKTKEFSAPRLNGDIATYFIKFSLIYPRFIFVPKDMQTNL